MQVTRLLLKFIDRDNTLPEDHDYMYTNGNSEELTLLTEYNIKVLSLEGNPVAVFDRRNGILTFNAIVPEGLKNIIKQIRNK